MKEELIFFSDMPGNRVHVINVEKGEVNMFASLNSIRHDVVCILGSSQNQHQIFSSLFTSVEHRVMKEVGNELKHIAEITDWSVEC